MLLTHTEHYQNIPLFRCKGSKTERFKTELILKD